MKTYLSSICLLITWEVLLSVLLQIEAMGPLEVRRLRYKTDKVIDEILMLTCHGFLLKLSNNHLFCRKTTLARWPTFSKKIIRNKEVSYKSRLKNDIIFLPNFEISKISTCFKSGFSVYLSGVVAWLLDILMGQGAADWWIKILSSHVTTLARQRCNQMSQPIGLRTIYIRSSLVSILPDLWDRYKYTLCILLSLSWCENNPSLRKVVMYKY